MSRSGMLRHPRTNMLTLKCTYMIMADTGIKVSGAKISGFKATGSKISARKARREPMNDRQRLRAVLNYEEYDRLPVVHFGFWTELLEKWAAEGHLKPEEIIHATDGTENEARIEEKLGFDFNYCTNFEDLSGFGSLWPRFEEKTVRKYDDGRYEYLNEYGVTELRKPGVTCIGAEITHTLVDRKSWEEHYLPRLRFGEDRYDPQITSKLAAESETRSRPLGLYCKSLYGEIRNWMGVEGLCLLPAEDEELYDEIIDTVADLAYKIVKHGLETGIAFDFAHYWEDIAFKNGPLINPKVFMEKIGPHYRRINDLLHSYGINIISLDCDGLIDLLIPTWIENGVNTMFPIEVGTWGASIAPWRGKYGRELRGVGGVNKHVMSYDRAAVDAEIERLKPLVELGGFLPCPDHRLPVDSKWELVQYYCERMRREFS